MGQSKALMSIFQRTKHWFTLSYTVADAPNYHIAQVLYHISIIFLAVSIFQGIFICALLAPAWLPIAIPATLLSWLGFAGIIYLVRQKQLARASYLLTGSAWIGYTGIGFITGHGALYAGIGYVFVVALSGILLQRQRLLIISGMSIISIIGLCILSSIDWYMPLITSSALTAPFLVVNVLLLTALIYIFMENLTTAQQAQSSSNTALREQTQARKTAERYVKTIVDQLPIILFSFDDDGRIRLAQGAGLDILNTTSERVIGRKITDLLADDPKAQATIQEALAGSTSRHTHNFRGRYLETFYLPVEEGDKQRVYGVSLDITDRYTIESEYIQSEQRFWNLATMLPDALIIAWADSGDITFSNRPTFLGYDLKGHNLLDWLTSIADPNYEDIITLQWQSYTQPNQMQLPDAHLRVKNNTGTWEWIRSRVSVLDTRADGTPETLLFTFSLITEQYEASERLRVSEKQLSIIFDESLDVILIIDLDEIIQRVNYAAYGVLGYDPAELVGQSLDVLMPPEKTMNTADEPVPQYGLSFESIPFFHADGHLVKMEMIATSVPWEDGAAILLTLRDVTQREEIREELATAQQRQRDIERQRDLMQARENLIYVIAHQVRSPLTTIKLATESIGLYQKRDKLTPQRLLKQTDKITQQIDYLDTMVGEMLTARDAILDKLSFSPQPHTLGAICQALIAQARSNHMAYTFIYRDDTRTAPALLDKTLLTWIVENLLENAVKYSSEGTTIRMTITEADETFTVSVQDEGIGIAPDDLEDIFEMFQRGSNVDSIRGTGIGLGLAYNAAIRHGGDLTCESELGSGSTFTLTLPVVVA